MIDEHGKAMTFLSLGEKSLFRRKGPHNMAVALQGCFVTGSLLCKGMTE